MAECTNIKALTSLFLAVLASIILCSSYLFRSNFYEPVSPSRTTLLHSTMRGKANQLLELSFDRSEDHTRRHDDNDSRIIDKHLAIKYEPTVRNLTDTLETGVQSTSNRFAGTATEKRGYIVALKIYEQQTMATGNLMQLQCFASKLNLRVVEPLMRESTLTTPLDHSKHTDMLQLEDIYDMQAWRQHAEKEGFMPLAKWEEFIRHTTQNAVLVQMKHPALTFLKNIRKTGLEFPHPFVSDTKAYQDGCGYKTVNKGFAGLKERKLTVIHRACFNFFSGEYVTLEAFKRDLLQGHDPNNVTVIIDEWRGFGDNQRVFIREKICSEAYTYRDHTHISSTVTRDAQHYIEKYLQQKSTTGYLAVIARYEMTALSCHMNGHHNASDPHAIIPFCLGETLKEVARMQTEKKFGDVFLSSDVGKYGSKSFVRHKYYDHQQEMEAFVGKVYGERMDIHDWERTFEETVQVDDAGYIAMVQQAIVARAKCVIFVGGGTFQRHTMSLYNELHPNQATRCVSVIKKCTNTNRPLFK